MMLVKSANKCKDVRLSRQQELETLLHALFQATVSDLHASVAGD